MLRYLVSFVLIHCAQPSLAQPFVLDPPAPEVIAADADDLADPGTIVVLLDDAAAAGRMVREAEAVGYALTLQENLAGLDMVMLVLQLPPGRSGAAAIAELEAMEPGSTAGVNHAYRADAAPLPSPKGREYAAEAVGWPGTGCRAQMAIGVIDTDLAPRSVHDGLVRKNFAGTLPETGTGTAHGTAISELLTGPGRLTGARVYHAGVVESVDGKPPAASVDALVRALNWLQENDVRLTNVSLAGPYNKIVDRTLQAAALRGMIVVAAAGNAGRDGPPRYPAAFDQTISVTAVDAAMVPFAKATEASRIDIAAPGVDVFVVRDGAGAYLSGTSIAAPFVTRIIAADSEAARLETVGDIRNWLGARARDLGAPGPDRVFGAGLVQTGTGCQSPDP